MLVCLIVSSSLAYRQALNLAWYRAGRDVIRGVWAFSEISGGGVDIPIPQVKIGLNFTTSKAEFGKKV